MAWSQRIALDNKTDISYIIELNETSAAIMAVHWCNGAEGSEDLSHKITAEDAAFIGTQLLAWSHHQAVLEGSRMEGGSSHEPF